VNSTASIRGFLRDENGIEYDLDLLEPYMDLFSPIYFLISGDTITDVRSNVSFLVPVLRGVYEKGAALVEAATDSEGVVTGFLCSIWPIQSTLTARRAPKTRCSLIIIIIYF
jgi:hypothetical protein